jgi:hypothetical protein
MGKVKNRLDILLRLEHYLKRSKPLDGFDHAKSSFYENDDDDDSEIDSDDEDIEDTIKVEVEDKKARKDAKKAVESAEQKANRESEELELRKARAAARVTLEIEDQKAIRTIDPQIFAFIMLTISDESSFALGNQKGWDKLEQRWTLLSFLKPLPAFISTATTTTMTQWKKKYTSS